MCGILGVIGRQFEDDVFFRALNELEHRGPDDSGMFRDTKIIIGHRRLSILDLSRNGHQPMRDERSGAVLTYNGEIYNYLEICKTLEALGCSFCSGSDTEVVLKALLAWGPHALQKFNGMWAFSLWLPSENRLFFARDRFGVKPFYYVHNYNLFAFSSEPKAILKLFPEYRRVDKNSLYELLANGQLYSGEDSFYEGVKILQPGSCGEFQEGTNKFKIWRYWNYPDHAVLPSQGEDAIDEFCDILKSAVSIRLRSDVPLGVTLSGGLDSTAVLAAAQTAGAKNISCYTSVYSEKERGEANWAQLAAGAYGISPIEVKTPYEDWLDALSKIAWYMDGPGYSPAVFPLWNLMAEARRRGTVVILDGQGADEALGGYTTHAVANVMRLISTMGISWERIREIPSVLKAASGTFGRKRLMLWMIRQNFPFLVPYHRWRSGALSVLRPEIARMNADKKSRLLVIPKNMDRVTLRLWWDHSQNILPGLLHYGDSISMAHGVEARNPFMDYRLVEWAFSQSADVKMANGKSKWPIREFLRREKQDKIAGRIDKKGYPTPSDEWLAKENGHIARELLLESNSKILEYAEPASIEKLIKKHIAKRFNVGNHIYRLISVELWLRRCICARDSEE